MGSLIGEAIGGLIDGIRGVVTREKLAKSFEDMAGKIRRSELVSDEAIEQANKTLEKMRVIRDQYQDD